MEKQRPKSLTCKYEKEDSCPTYASHSMLKKNYCDPLICGNATREDSNLVEKVEGEEDD